MIKRILVPTDGSKNAMQGVRYAVQLGARYDAAVCGLYVVDVKLLEGPFLRDLSASLGTAPYVNYQGNINLILEERGKAALEALSDLCAESKVDVECTMATGVVHHSILENSELCDLVVMGRGGEHSEWLDGLLGSTTEAVARRSSIPVLITESDNPGDGEFLVAYDGSSLSKKALRAAADLAEEWNRTLQLLVVGDASMEKALTEAKDYLADHAVSANCMRCTGDPAEQIVDYAGSHDISILVMGAYGHSKVRELLLSSTTAYVLNHTPCPVLLVR